MRDILVTSSVLILALLVLRQVFRKTISRRVQYALWGLVLLRLLVPVNLPAMEHNVLTTAETAGAAVTERIDYTSVYLDPVGHTEGARSYVPPPDESTPSVAVRDSRSVHVYDTFKGYSEVAQVTSEEGAQLTTTWYAKTLPLTDILTYIWYAGIAVMACWLVFSNLRFWRNLRRVRVPYNVENCKYRVYMVDAGLPSPCLFGLFRPAVYLTPAAAAPESLRHVLAHETTHVRHLDPLWSLLRGVCLAVYWFDPLVWIAAAVSKTDCELACDEGALQRLDQEERVAYGRTLLALVPVVKRPADPMLAATMTSGKRRLKDRITRIAENRQTVSAALFAVLAAAVLLCAVTFTGAKTSAPRQDGPLSGTELTYFNEKFFNIIENQFASENIRNQFLTSLYEKPEDIDLGALFYCGIPYGEVGAAGRSNIAEGWPEVLELAYGGVEPDCATYALSTADMDALLKKYTGLTVAETNGTGLEDFTYLADYDAYYWVHGDTNYRGDVTITAGEREGGMIRLYYPDSSASYGCDWLCVTLRETKDGYHFVSNLPSEKPAIPTVYPDWDPELTISLVGLEPYRAPAVDIQRFAAKDSEVLAKYSVNNQIIVTCRTHDRGLGIGVENEDAYDCFLHFTSQQDQIIDSVSIDYFSDLFGHDGLVVSYLGLIGKEAETRDESIKTVYQTVNDYYTFTENSTPVLLARAYENASIIDLDGDGEFELATSGGNSALLFFQRNGTLYCADVEALVENAWPEADSISFYSWDISGRCLGLTGEVPIPDNTMQGTATRCLYFNGDELLLYRDGAAYTDHVKDSIVAPEEVLAAARAFAMSQCELGTDAYELVDGDITPVHADFDDWRIESLSGPYYRDVGELWIEVWRLNYECHTSTSYQVSLAGARYITEDGWVSPGIPNGGYLYFQLAEDGSRTHLYAADARYSYYSPNSSDFWADMTKHLLDMGLLKMAGLDGQTLLDMLSAQPTELLNDLAGYPAEEQLAAMRTLTNHLAEWRSYDAMQQFAFCESHVDITALSETGRALWEWLEVAAEPDPLLGGTLVMNRRLGRSLLIPSGWQGLASVSAGGAVSDSHLVFALRAASAGDTSYGGLVWTLTAYTPAELQAAFPDASWSGVFAASSFIIGSDDKYVYLLSTPTDIQYPPADTVSQARYHMLKLQSRAVLTDFLARNGITPNPLCSDADGCYRYTGSAEPVELTPDAVLTRFVTNPVSFLNSTAQLPEASQQELCQILAAYYDSGPSAQQARFRDAMHSVTQAGLSSGGTAVYELLRTSCARPGPTELTNEDQSSIQNAIDATLESWRTLPGVVSLDVLETGFYQEETARIVEQYTASLLANANGWTDDYTAKMTAVRVVWTVETDADAAEAELASLNWTDGANACWFYLLPDPISGAWEIWDSAACAVPARYGADAANLPFAESAQPTVSFTQYGSYEEAYNSLPWENNALELFQELAEDGFTVVSWAYVGTPHGTAATLHVIYRDGTLASLPLPPKSEWGVADPAENLTLSEDGSILTYTASFDDDLVSADGTALWHRTGTYRYAYDVSARTVSLTIDS